MTRIFHWFYMGKMDPMSGFDIRLVFTLPPRDSTLQYTRCAHLWNNFPCIITLSNTYKHVRDRKIWEKSHITLSGKRAFYKLEFAARPQFLYKNIRMFSILYKWDKFDVLNIILHKYFFWKKIIIEPVLGALQSPICNRTVATLQIHLHSTFCNPSITNFTSCINSNCCAVRKTLKYIY